MARKYLPGPVKTLAATTAETIRWSENETLNGSAIKQLHIILTGTDNDLGSITGITVFAGGVPIFNLLEEEISQFLSVNGKRELAADAATWFTIPFDWMDGSCALPPNAALRVELVKDNTGAAGTAELAYTIDETQPAACYPLFIASAAGVAASSTSANIPITQPGLLKGLLIPDSADVTALRLYVQGQMVWNMDTAGFMLASQDIYSGVATTSAHKFLFLDTPLPVGPGTRLEINTAAGFGGSAERFGVLTLVPSA
jgi:hypothetical protein